MAESAAADGRRLSLLPWALGTVDVVSFALVGVVAAHAAGVLGGLLQGLNTLAGVAVFLYLWAIFVLAARWVLSTASLADASLRALALRGVAAGGASGVAFLLGILAVTAVPQLLTSQPLSALLIVLIGTVVAAPIGALVGLVLGGVDIALYRAAGYLLPDEPRRETADGRTTPDRR
ncbi:hypothetical protein [Haloarcula nitratireducens]|uniref:DUF7965 domain-containing protein n=1 Tax=Haloarcula nitratireducens TaxID=2487749 RepID=A0AAW4PI98_9EURY|nr:hypothetical protein [Halomicroarcula nitratireducens]MBX0297160.1 hypothetical protein [Halomicroarcula nitratireducens]